MQRRRFLVPGSRSSIFKDEIGFFLSISFEKNNIEADISLSGMSCRLSCFLHKIDCLIDYSAKEEKSIVENAQCGNYGRITEIRRVSENIVRE